MPKKRKIYATVEVRVVVPREADPVEIEEEVIARLDAFKYGAGHGTQHIGLLCDAYVSLARKDEE